MFLALLLLGPANAGYRYLGSSTVWILHKPIALQLFQAPGISWGSEGSCTASTFANSQGGQLEGKSWRARLLPPDPCQEQGQTLLPKVRREKLATTAANLTGPIIPFPRIALRPGHTHPHPQFQATFSRLSPPTYSLLKPLCLHLPQAPDPGGHVPPACLLPWHPSSRWWPQTTTAPCMNSSLLP